ncbi:MAG TPA: ABC transporter permease [bacterium]|nr:ABC transporter permease [bacterium]
MREDTGRGETPGGAIAPGGRRRGGALSWRRLVRSPHLVVGCVVLALVIGTALFAWQIAPYSPTDQAFVEQLRPPSSAHLFGTDEFGRDIFSRVLFGARIALIVGLLADGIAASLGILLGIVSGYFGGRVDSAVMRIVDVMLAFPYLLLAMIVVAILGSSLTNAMIAIGIVYTPQFARLVRGAVLAIRGQEFVEAARALGAGAVRVLVRHVLPNVLSPIIVMATLTVGFTIVETAGLSFLGLGASPPTPEWGSMLATGRSYMLTAPWIATFPGLAILITVVGFNLVGDGLRDLLDPRLRGRGF